jgi:hypothetical protein
MVIQMGFKRWTSASIANSYLSEPGPQSLWRPGMRPSWDGPSISWLIATVSGDDPLRVSARFGWAGEGYPMLQEHFSVDQIARAFDRVEEGHRAGGAPCLYKIGRDGVGVTIWWQLEQTG